MILRVVAHCQDRCSIRAGHGARYNGYVPYELGIGGGDYINLEIDIETGCIVGWDRDDVKEAIRDLKLVTG